MARRAAKRKGGRPKGLQQTKKAISKIRSGMKAYWASAEGKKRKAAMKKKGRKTTTTTTKRKPGRPKGSKNKTAKLASASPKVTTRRGRPKGSKNKPKTATKPAVASRSKRKKSSMAH